MDPLLERIAASARAALEELRARAAAEGWSTERTEREKQAIALAHEVTLCETEGCLGLVTPVPGFHGTLCAACEARSGSL